MTVLFHGNFALNRARMAGVLKMALRKPESRDADLAKPFGYGAPFGAIYRSWLHKTGMTELRLPIVLTPRGKVVYENDPGLEAPTTRWFLHHELVSDPQRAEAWHYFALQFLPKHATFSRSELVDGLTMKLSPHSMKHFGPGSKLNQQIARKILEVYTDPAGLGDLGVIEQHKDGFRRLATRPLGPWESLSALAKAYR